MTKDGRLDKLFSLQNNVDGYWWGGEMAVSVRVAWVLYKSTHGKSHRTKHRRTVHTNEPL